MSWYYWRVIAKTVALATYLSVTLGLFIFSNSNEEKGCYKSNCTFTADRGFGHEGCIVELTWTSMNTSKYLEYIEKKYLFPGMGDKKLLLSCEYPFRKCPSFGDDQPCWLTEGLWCPLINGCINPGYFLLEVISGLFFGLGIFFFAIMGIYYLRERTTIRNTVQVV